MHGNTTAAVRSEDERAVRRMLDGVYAAWADNDADAFTAHYTEDASAALPGSYRGSREEIRAHMAAGFAGPLKGSTVRDEILSVRFPGAGLAVVVSESGVLMAGEGDLPAGRLVTATWVLVRQDGDWLVTAYHNCPAAGA